MSTATARSKTAMTTIDAKSWNVEIKQRGADFEIQALVTGDHNRYAVFVLFLPAHLAGLFGKKLYVSQY